ADFVMLTGDVTAISYSSLIAIPVSCLVVTLLAAMLPLMRKIVIQVSPTDRRHAPMTYAALCAGLRATQLYRIADESILRTKFWGKRKNIIPLPPPANTAAGVLIPSIVGNAVEFREDENGEDRDTIELLQSTIT